MSDVVLGIKITADGKAAQAELRKTEAELNQLGAAGKQSAQNVASMDAALSRISSAASLAKGAIAGMVSAFSAREIIRTADAYTGMQAKLKLATNSARELAMANDRLFASAQANMAPLAEQVQLYSRLSVAMKEMGRSQADTLQLVDIIGQALRISGTDAAGAAAGIMQLGQALGSGVLRGDEFNSMMENSPRLAKALADGLKVPTSALRAMAEQGELTAQKVVTALQSQAGVIAAEFRNIPLTVSGAWQQLSNALTKYIGEADQASQSSRDLAQGINLIATNIDILLTPLAKMTQGWGLLLYAVGKANNAISDTFSMQANPGRSTQLAELEKYKEQFGVNQAINREVWEANRKATAGIDATTAALERMGDVQRKVYEEAKRQNIEPAFALAVANQESRFNQAAHSKKGAIGVMQLMPDTAKSLGVDPGQLEDNIKGGVMYLKQMLETFKGDMRIAAAAYNAGPHRQSLREGRVPAIKETQDYVKAVAGFYDQWKAEIGGGLTPFADAKDMQKDTDHFYQVLTQAIAGRTKLEDAASQTRVAAQQQELAKLKQAAEEASKASEIQIKTVIDTQGIAAATAAIDAAEAKQAEYLQQMNTLAGGKDTAAVEAAQRQVQAIDEMIAKAKELNRWEEDGAKLTNDRAIAEEQLQQARIEAGGQSLELEKALAENHAKYDAMRQQAMAAQRDQQRQNAESAIQEARFMADAQKSIIDGQLEAQKTAIAVAQAQREQRAASLTGYAAEQAARENIQASLQDELTLIEATKNATLAKLNIDIDQAQRQIDALTAERAITDELTKQHDLEDRIRALQAEQDDLLRQQLDTMNQVPKQRAQATTQATTQTVKLDTQNVREAQLEMNAFWDQYMQRIQSYADLWDQVSGDTASGFGQMLAAAAQYSKALAQIDQRYTDLNTGKKTRFAESLGDYAGLSQGLEEAAAGMGMLGQQFAIMAAQQEKGSASWKTYNTMAIASVAAAQVAALAQGILAVATAMASDAKLGGVGAIASGVAVAAMLASLGLSIGASGGGGGASDSNSAEARQAKAGTGTVFGDSTAKSESIASSLEIIRDNSSNDLSYSAAMLRALEGIESAIKATTNAYLLNLNELASGMKKAGVTAGALNDNKSIADWGVSFPAKRFFDILQQGMDRGSFYVTNNRNNDTDIANLNFSGPAKQIRLALLDLQNALIEGGKAFGLTAQDFRDRLWKFVVDLGLISLKGLNGEDIEKQLSAIMSNLSDRMAKKLMPGLDAFEKVGEGYAETFWRVAEGINRSKGELERLGMTAIDYKDIINKQGDVAAEIVRQTILGQAQMSRGVSLYVSELTGSAEDIIDAYQKLKTASDLMRTSGLSGGDVNLDRAMINAAGGLDAFVKALQDFQEGFLTQGQQLAAQSKLMLENFTRLGVAMPASKQGFMDLLNGIDQTTEAGRKLYGSVMALAGGFGQLEDSIQAIKDKYADLLDPFAKFKRQITDITDDFGTLLEDALNKVRATGPLNTQIGDLQNRRSALENGPGGQAELQAIIDQNAKDSAELQRRIDAEIGKGAAANQKLIQEWQEQQIGLANASDNARIKLLGRDEAQAQLDRLIPQQIELIAKKKAAKTQAEKDEIQAELDQVNARLKVLDTWLNGSQQTRDALTKKRAALADAQDKLERAQQNGNQANIAKYSKLVASITADITTLEAAIAEQRIDVGEGIKERLAAINTELAAAIAANDAALAENLQAERARISREAGQAMVKSLQDIWDQLQAQIQAGQDQFNAMAEKIAGLRGGGALQQAQYSSAQSKTALAQAALDQFHGTAMQEIPLIKNLQDAIYAEYEAKLALINAGKEALEKQKTDAEKVLSDWSSKLATLTQQLEQINGLQDSLQSKIDELTDTISGQSIANAKRGYDEAKQGIIDYRDAVKTGTPRDPERELKLLADAEQAVNTYYQRQIDAITKANEAVIAGKRKEMNAATKAHDAQIKALQKELDAARKLSDAVKAAADYAKGLALSQHSDLSPERRVAEAQRQYQDLLAKANTGDADAIAQMSGASDAYLQAAKDYYGSGASYSQILAGVQEAMTSLGAMDVPDADSIQSHIDALNETYQAYMDGMNDSIDAISDPDRNGAITALKKQQMDDLQKLQGLADATETLISERRAEAKNQADAAQASLDAINAQLAAIDNNAAIDQLKTDTSAKLEALNQRLAGAIEQAGQEANTQMATLIQNAMDSNILQQAQVDALFAMATKMGITGMTPPPGYAAGGYAQAGLALVGEQGPELVRFERPAQVLTAEQTRKALTPHDDEKIAKAIADLKAEMRAVVVTQSNANPQIIDRLAGIEARLNQMERTQRLKG